VERGDRSTPANVRDHFEDPFVVFVSFVVAFEIKNAAGQQARFLRASAATYIV
jgi:hypothetical protein